MSEPVKVGTRGRFFHPRTMGVMHEGVVEKVHDDGTVTVKFHVDGKRWRTSADCICRRDSRK